MSWRCAHDSAFTEEGQVSFVRKRKLTIKSGRAGLSYSSEFQSCHLNTNLKILITESQGRQGDPVEFLVLIDDLSLVLEFCTYRNDMFGSFQLTNGWHKTTGSIYSTYEMNSFVLFFLFCLHKFGVSVCLNARTGTHPITHPSMTFTRKN